MLFDVVGGQGLMPLRDALLSSFALFDAVPEDSPDPDAVSSSSGEPGLLDKFPDAILGRIDCRRTSLQLLHSDKADSKMGRGTKERKRVEISDILNGEAVTGRKCQI